MRRPIVSKSERSGTGVDMANLSKAVCHGESDKCRFGNPPQESNSQRLGITHSPYTDTLRRKAGVLRSFFGRWHVDRGLGVDEELQTQGCGKPGRHATARFGSQPRGRFKARRARTVCKRLQLSDDTSPELVSAIFSGV